MNCDLLSSSYRCWEYLAFGPQLQQCRTRYLEFTRDRQRALLLGEGDGRFLDRLLIRNPALEIDCVDSSGRMIELARTRSRPHPQPVRFHQTDAESFPLPPATYDLIVTHFFLDCFNATALETLLNRVAHSAQPGAVWLLADFQTPSRGWTRLRAQAWLRLLYAFFGLTTRLRTRQLHDPSNHLRQNGFKCIHRTEKAGGLLKSEAWIHHPSPPPAPHTRQHPQRLIPHNSQPA